MSHGGCRRCRWQREIRQCGRRRELRAGLAGIYVANATVVGTNDVFKSNQAIGGEGGNGGIGLDGDRASRVNPASAGAASMVVRELTVAMQVPAALARVAGYISLQEM